MFWSLITRGFGFDSDKTFAGCRDTAPDLPSVPEVVIPWIWSEVFETSDVFTGIAWNITYLQYPVRRDFKTSSPPPIASGCSSCSSGKQNVRQTCFKAAWVHFFHLRSKQSRHHFAMCLCVSHLSANERNDRMGSQWKTAIYFLAKGLTSHNTIHASLL